MCVFNLDVLRSQKWLEITGKGNFTNILAPLIKNMKPSKAKKLSNIGAELEKDQYKGIATRDLHDT